MTISTTRRFLGALTALCLFAGPALAATYPVSSTAALTALKAKLQPGDHIALAPGTYTTIGDLNGLKLAAPGVVIEASDPTSWPIIAGMEVDKVDGITFRNVLLTVNPRTQTVANVTGSAHVYFDHVRFDDPEKKARGGLMFRASSASGVTNSEFLNTGTAVLVLDSAGIDVTANRFHDLLGDGVQGWQSTRVTIDGNRFIDFHPLPGDHPDCIQFFTAGTTTSSTDLTITRNTCVRGSGAPVQGIFLGNENGLPYKNVVITDNAVIGGQPNGIAAGIFEGGLIARNLVVSYPDWGSSIVLDGGRDVTVTDNTAGILKRAPTVNLIASGNTTPATAAMGSIAELSAWQAATTPAPLPMPPPVVQPPPVTPPAPVVPAIDTRDAVINAMTAAGLAQVAVQQARIAALEAVVASRDASLAQIATLAASGVKVTSAAKAKPLFEQIGAMAGQ